MEFAAFKSDDHEDSLTLSFSVNNGIRLSITNLDLGGDLNEFDLTPEQARGLASALLKAAAASEAVGVD